MTTSSIGSGGTYSTVALWIASIPATLTQDYIGEIIWTSSGSELTTTATMTITGTTVGAFKIILRPQTGKGFADNASKLSNALRYNASNGACIRMTSGSGDLFEILNDAVEIRGLQLKKDSEYRAIVRAIDNSYVNRVLDGCIFQGQGTGTDYNMRTTAVTVTNCLYIGHGQNGWENANGNDSYTDLVIALIGTGTSRTGFSVPYGAPTLHNVAVYGFAHDYAGVAGSSSNNATDLSAFEGTGFGTSGQVSLVGATEWQNVTNTTEDFRLNASSVKLKGNGATSGPGIDIVGQTRVVPYTIGVWQAINNNITISPTVGSLTFTGQQPGVTTAKLITPLVGTAVLTGLQFSFNVGFVHTPSVGSLAITGTQPIVTVTAALSISPTTGSLGITGTQPVVTIGASQFAQPDAGALAITGQAPIVTLGLQVFIQPVAGALAIVGGSPIVTVQNNLPVGPSVTENIRALGQVTSIRAIRGVSGITAIDFTPTEAA